MWQLGEMIADCLEKKISLKAARIIISLTIYTSKKSLYRKMGWEKLSIKWEQWRTCFILQNNPGPVSWIFDWSDATNCLFFSGKFCEQVLFFANRGHLQALKVCDLKVLCPNQLRSWVVHKRPVALAKLSVPTHHLSLFRVP